MQEEIQTKHIRNPRRILCLGEPDSGVLPLLQGTAPEPRSVPAHVSENDDAKDALSVSTLSDSSGVNTTVAGTSHALPLRTKYYTSTVPIWLDETRTPAAWTRDFISPDAAEVVRAVGAWIVVFRDEKTGNARESARQLMEGVRAAIDAAHGEMGEWDGVCLVVAMPPALTSGTNKTGSAGEPSVEEIDAREDWEDTCWLSGFEFIEGWVKGEEAERRNEAGELRGLARLREALEACEWEAPDDSDAQVTTPADDSESSLHTAAFGDETIGFGLERAQMEREFAGLKMAMAGGDENDTDEQQGEQEQVEELEQMMQRLQAVKDMSAGLPEQERRRLAARAVDDIMKGV